MGKTLTGSFTEYCVQQCQMWRNLHEGYKVSCVQKYWRWCIMLQIVFINQVFLDSKQSSSMTRLSWIERLSFTLAKNIYFYPSAYLLFFAYCRSCGCIKINIKISESFQNSNVLVWNPKLKCPYGFLLDFYMLSCLLSVCWLKSWCWFSPGFSPWTILLLWFQLRWLRAQV